MKKVSDLDMNSDENHTIGKSHSNRKLKKFPLIDSNAEVVEHRISHLRFVLLRLCMEHMKQPATVICGTHG